MKFGEVPQPNKGKLLESLGSGLQRYISNISIKTNISEVCFLPWKQEILSLLKYKVYKLTPYSYNNVLGKKSNYDELLLLPKRNLFLFLLMKLVIISHFVCKKYYMESLQRGICNFGTFIETNMITTDVSSKHVSFLKQYGVNSSGKIPFLYWISKLQKIHLIQDLLHQEKVAHWRSYPWWLAFV